MELILVLLGTHIGTGVLGWLACAHVHSIVKATTAATTINSSEATALNGRISGLGDQVQKLTTALGEKATAALTAAAAPKQ